MWCKGIKIKCWEKEKKKIGGQRLTVGSKEIEKTEKKTERFYFISREQTIKVEESGRKTKDGGI